MNKLRVHRDQLVAVARVTPYAMLGYAVNVGLAAAAFWDRGPRNHLLVWILFSLAICGIVGIRSLRRAMSPQISSPDQMRSARSALLFAVLLALPWSVLTVVWIGTVNGTSEALLLAFAVGMSASGSMLLAPIPAAALTYASIILCPLITKMLLLGDRENIILAALAFSFLIFLVVLVTTNARMFMERLAVMQRLKVSIEDAKEANEAAQRATAAKSEFFATMSHEIRTPLNSVIGYTSLVLARRGLNAEDARDLEIVRDAGRSLLSTVNDILDFSAIEAGRLRLSLAPTLLRPTIESCLSLMQVEARAKGLILSGEIDSALDEVTVDADAQRVRQVLVNLVGNAVKFTSEGRVDVQATCSRRSGDVVTVTFTVKDTGPGIPQKSIPELFNRFSQLDGSYERRFAGSGLGLAISKSIVVAMHGEIGVESEVGVGSAFWFELPLVVSRSSATIDRSGEQEPPGPGGLNVLVVDDMEPNRRLTSTVLRRAGHRAVTAASGADAITLASSEIFDCILMDMQMPRMNGLAATQKIRSLPPSHGQVPIIAMTANVLPNEIASCYAAGMTAHIGKPFEIDELLRTIEAACGGESSRARARVPAEMVAGQKSF
ncbi:ATP-binding protein [Hyphomicrobium sp.]|uniref:ATP-binding protein n=1 Tax=Hyphomicrobium sp. TaxID=82 RepID=UPI002D782090|nr:ATP-binding protein [Hyphomicrobium sp.]HET6389251.1 ATP-binding protein [Hyphomicrobium sp.]